VTYLLHGFGSVSKCGQILHSVALMYHISTLIIIQSHISHGLYLPARKSSNINLSQCRDGLHAELFAANSDIIPLCVGYILLHLCHLI